MLAFRGVVVSLGIVCRDPFASRVSIARRRTFKANESNDEMRQR